MKPLFSILPEFENQYHKHLEIGKEYLLDKNIIITGLVRNLENKLYKNIVELDKLRSSCKNLTYFIYENDSSDQTAQILSNCNKDIDNFYYQSENLGLKAFTHQNVDLLKSNQRTEALAQHRNFCRNFIKNHSKDIDYIVVLDLDFQKISIDGIINSFGWFKEHPDINALAGNSFEIKMLPLIGYQTLWNYDCWAYRGTWWEDLQNKADYYHHDPMMWFGLWQPPIGSEPIKVNSAFGGTAIYPAEIFYSAEYEGYDCEHVCFHKNLYYVHKNFNLSINPSQIMLF